NPQQLTAVLLVDDADVKRLAPGQKTRLKIDELPGQVIDGEVVEIARHAVEDADRTKMRQADLSPLLMGLVTPGRSGALYEARVGFRGEQREARSESKTDPSPLAPSCSLAPRSSLLAPRSSLLIGARGEAKVTAERITVGQRIYRYLAQTFRLPM